MIMYMKISECNVCESYKYLPDGKSCKTCLKDYQIKNITISGNLPKHISIRNVDHKLDNTEIVEDGRYGKYLILDNDIIIHEDGEFILDDTRINSISQANFEVQYLLDKISKVDKSYSNNSLFTNTSIQITSESSFGFNIDIDDNLSSKFENVFESANLKNNKIIINTEYSSFRLFNNMDVVIVNNKSIDSMKKDVERLVNEIIDFKINS